MSRPIYRWRQDELADGRTLHHDSETGADLKVQDEAYQVWLEADGITVRVEERQEDKSWKVVETYKAKSKPKFS